MAKRKEQYQKQQTATVGHSNKIIRRVKALTRKIERIQAIDKASQTG